MPGKAPPFQLHFELPFLERYAILSSKEQKTIDKALVYLAANPRHPSLNVHKAKNILAKYTIGGNEVFIAYASRAIWITFEYGPEPGMIALRNCGQHEPTERKM
jgi:hypothetical protein